jgi:starch synthase
VAVLDAATVLCMTSVSEGLPRVALEAFVRSRGVVAFAVGGLPDLVEDGVTGYLVPRRDTAALAAALERVLADPGLAERLGRGGRRAIDELGWTPERYAAAVADMVHTVVGARPARGT